MGFYIAVAIINALLFCMGRAGKFVQVAEFPIGRTSFSEINDEINPQSAVATKEISCCFRFMLRYNRGFYIIKNKQFSVGFKSVKFKIGFITINPWPYDDGGINEYSRSFRFCGTYIPGKWSSLLGQVLCPKWTFLPFNISLLP